MDIQKENMSKAGYSGILNITIILLVLTAVNILLAQVGHSALISGLIVAIATLQGTIMLVWLMHLNLDSMLLRVFVGGVFLLFIIVLVITFFDYSFR